ncbi:hypothetical protein AWC13_04650 [Mycobacterium kubicae]|nr:hypothetical protein AWC13_04650 [Mycobacterium kubicae]
MKWITAVPAPMATRSRRTHTQQSGVPAHNIAVIRLTINFGWAPSEVDRKFTADLQQPLWGGVVIRP